MTKDYEDSISGLFNKLKAGDASAVEKLWNLYFGALVAEARKRLGKLPRRVEDEEDVALSVFRSLIEGAAAGRFAGNQNRSDLWRLLVCLTKQKVVDLVRRRTRAKRGGGQVRGESVFISPQGDLSTAGIERVAGDAPTPELLAMMAEEHQRLLELLQDETLRDVAALRLAGYANLEIAKQMGISERSVERKLKLIRERWAKEMEQVK